VERGLVQRRDRDAIDALRQRRRLHPVAKQLLLPLAGDLIRHMAGAGRLPVAERVGVGLSHRIAGDGLELGVDHEHGHAQIVAEKIVAAQTSARSHGTHGTEVHDGVADLERAPRTEVDG
jgi:hypothetical protein